MKQTSGSKHELDSYIEDIRDSQRNTVFPDTLRSGRSVDALLWKGDPKAPLVQRVGIVVFAFFFLLAGISFVFMAFDNKDKDWFLAVFAVLWLALAGRLTRNAFRK